MYWPAFAWMGANPVVPAPEEQAPLDDDPDSLFDFGEEDESDLLYDNILGIYDELGGDEFDGFNAYEFFNTMEEDDLADIAFLLQALGPKTRQRGIKFKHTRKSWEEYSYMLVETKEFEDRFHMSKDHFDYLLENLRDAITVDYLRSLNSTSGNEPISPESILAMGLEFCSLPVPIPALGDMFGVSKSSARRCVNMFLDAIDCNTSCPELKIELPDPTNTAALLEMAGRWSNVSTAFGLFMHNLGAIDGWLPRTEMPRDVTNQTDYFSGHYHCYGLNVQAMCDPDLAFTYLCVAAPGKVNDIRAFYRCQRLLQWLDALPEGFHVVADNAYPLSRKILIPFTSAQFVGGEDYHQTYNFYLSQMRIRIEMSFGLLTTKWKILRKTMNYSNEKNAQIVRVCAKLHNYCIRMKKLLSDYSTLVFTGDSPSLAVLRQLNIDNIDGYGNDTGTPFGYLATHPDEDDDTANPSDYQEHDAGSYFPNLSPTTSLRDEYVTKIYNRGGLKRPASNILRNRDNGRG